MSKYDDLYKTESDGQKAAIAILTTIIGGIITAIVNSSKSSQNNSKISGLESENDRLRARNDDLKSGFLGSWLNSDEIADNNRSIADNNDRINKLRK